MPHFLSRFAPYRSKPLRWWLSTPLYALRIAGQPLQRNLHQLIYNQPWAWAAAGRPLPAPPVLRRALLRDTARANGLTVFVETGTWHGDTVAFMRPHVEKIYSVELGDALYAAARARFGSDAQIVLFHGDSTDILPRISAQIDAPALFWLDGHFSAGVTARGDLETPILAEINTLLQSAKTSAALAQSVIFIDDARDFGQGDYPSIETLRELVLSHFPGAKFEVELDIIRIFLQPRESLSIV